MTDKLQACLESVRARTDFEPEVALVLGSGLGGLADEMDIDTAIPYETIEGFPVSTVKGHTGRFVFGRLNGIKVVAMQGRVHYYEGYAMEDVVLPIRLMGKLGARILFLTNAAGGMGDGFEAGDFMLIEDHISLFIPSPLIGPNDEAMGPRFPDMTEVYNRKLRQAIQGAADAANIPLQHGVYVQLTGPQFETPTEIQLLKELGAHAAGMSTVCEAITAHHMGLKVCGISCISNLAAGISPDPLTHEEVYETGQRVAPVFRRLVTDAIRAVAEVDV